MIHQRDFFPEDDQVNEIFYYSIKWLHDYGYISYDIPRNGPMSYECQLTEKSLNLLNKMPNSLENSGETIGQKIVKLLKEGAKEALFDIINKVIEAGCNRL